MPFFASTTISYAHSHTKKMVWLLISFVIVAFGQPAWNSFFGLIAAICGYACMWRVLLVMPNTKQRFMVATIWFTAVQLLQLAWFISHPYVYIYAVYLVCAILMGLQWGVLSIWMTPRLLMQRFFPCALAGLWTLLEWSRLFILSGLPFNPIGLSLSGAIYPLQLASLIGIYGLSFWVILTNVYVLQAMVLKDNWRKACLIALLPYLFGIGHFTWHQYALQKDGRILHAILVQPALSPEENRSFQNAEEARQFVLGEWYHILSTLKNKNHQPVDLLVFPEYLVPYGTFYAIFPKSIVHQLFLEVFGDISHAFPSHDSPYATWIDTTHGLQELVSNAYFAQTLANIFHSHVVIGLQYDAYADEDSPRPESYSAAFHFTPDNQAPNQYKKRILVPMGEYIPFEWCRTLAASYGISRSFSCGTQAKVFQGPVPFSASICYEEIYGHLMRENRQQGAQMLVNLTNDGWYPNSRLPKQHFDHARLRTVENGIPLLRACNTGVTTACDSCGRIIGVFGNNHMHTQEQSGALVVDVPLYHYHTLYSHYGDFFILGISIVSLLSLFSIKKIL